jgi:hypothetical protein
MTIAAKRFIGDRAARAALLAVWSVAFLAPLELHATEFLVVTRAASGAWSFQESESFSVNGKEKLRSTPLSTAAADSWDSKSIGHLADASMSSYAVIVRAADGTLLARAGVSGDWLLLIPDGSKSKTPQKAADIWKEASLTFKKDRKDKTPESVRLQDIYAIVPGIDPTLSAARLVTEVSWHRLPGMDDGQAFRQSVGMIPQAVKSYSSGAALEKIRDYTRTAMASCLEKWSSGDASVSTLEECLLLAKASETAFPGDASQMELKRSGGSIAAWRSCVHSWQGNSRMPSSRPTASSSRSTSPSPILQPPAVRSRRRVL